MTARLHFEYQVAKRPTKAAARRLHALARVEALTVGEPAHMHETLAERLEELDGLTEALDSAVRCRRCGKKLEKPRCKARHFGDDCWAIELAAGRVTDDGGTSC